MSVEIPKLVSFYYRNTRMGAYTETIVLRDGKEIREYDWECSRSGRHCEKYYLEEDVRSADVVLTIDISNSGKHYCSIEVKRWNVESIKRALEIHKCRRVLEQLEEQANSIEAREE